MDKDIVSTSLRWAFRYVIYPGVIYGTLLLILGTIILIIARVRSSRVTIAAVMPVVALSFVVSVEDSTASKLAYTLGRLEDWGKFAIGAVVAILLLEAARILLDTDTELGPALYALFISSTGVFILYAIMSQVLSSVHMALFGFVTGGGFQMIFRGLPIREAFLRARRSNRSEKVS